MSAVENIITDNLPIWSSSFQSKSSSGRGTSSKRTLYGVKKLRELILDLAVRGLLVPQDPNDEPASKALEAIKAKVRQIAANEKFTSNQVETEITDGQFDIPENWVWCKLNDLAAIARGGSPRPIKDFITDDSTGLNWIKIGDSVRGSRYIDSTEQKIRKEGLSRTREVHCGDLILSNSMSFGYPYIMRVNGCIHDGWLVLRLPNEKVDKLFMYNLFLSPYAKKCFSQSAAGAVVQNLNVVKVSDLNVALPPLAEQHRIVAKVDELMALCDTLEQQQEDSIQAHETLVEALLEALTDAIDADASQTAWQRISEHFDVLFTTEHSIDKLKETILQLAVMGKLIPQDPKDEKISAQIDKAVQYKSEIAELKKIRADKEKYLACARFVEPTNWCWLCLGDFMHVLGGKRVPAGYKLLNDKTDHVYLRVTDMKNHSITQDDLKYIEPKIYESIKRYVISADDIYITIAGTIGYVGAVPDNLDGANLTENAAKLVFGEMDKNFLIYVLSSIYVQRQFQHAVNQMAQPKLSLVSIKGTSVALPPLAEQHRIVAKVDELMTLCDELKQSLQQAQQSQIHLTDAVVENAL
jgi:type I restriction enzyme S subunit